MSALISVTVSMLTAVLAIGCSQTENKNAAVKPTAAPTQTTAPTVAAPASPIVTPVVSNSAPTPSARLKDLPPEGGDKPTNAAFDGYPYSYKKDGEKTVATFGPKLLPSDKDLVAGAIRDIINRSYGDKVTAAPHIEGSGSAQSIRIAGSKHQYVVVPNTDPAGEIHLLIITRLE